MVSWILTDDGHCSYEVIHNESLIVGDKDENLKSVPAKGFVFFRWMYNLPFQQANATRLGFASSTPDELAQCIAIMKGLLKR